MGISRRKRRNASLASSPASGIQELGGDFILEDVNAHHIDRTQFIIHLHSKDVDPESAEEVSESGVTPTMANQFARGLSVLSGFNRERPILVEMSTCGGDVEAGMQMYDSILACPNPVTVLAHRWARSMSSIIPLAADKFVMMPGAKYMFHLGTATFSGLDQETDTFFKELKEARERMYIIYVTRLKEQGAYSRWSEQRIVKMLEDKVRENIDVWLSSREARRWGFADDVFNGNWETLRAVKRNEARRKRMIEAANESVWVDIQVRSRLRVRDRAKKIIVPTPPSS